MQFNKIAWHHSHMQFCSDSLSKSFLKRRDMHFDSSQSITLSNPAPTHLYTINAACYISHSHSLSLSLPTGRFSECRGYISFAGNFKFTLLRFSTISLLCRMTTIVATAITKTTAMIQQLKSNKNLCKNNNIK